MLLRAHASEEIALMILSCSLSIFIWLQIWESFMYDLKCFGELLGASHWCQHHLTQAWLRAENELLSRSWGVQAVSGSPLYFSWWRAVPGADAPAAGAWLLLAKAGG